MMSFATSNHIIVFSCQSHICFSARWLVLSYQITDKASSKQIKVETPPRMHVKIHTYPLRPHQISFHDPIATMELDPLVCLDKMTKCGGKQRNVKPVHCRLPSSESGNSVHWNRTRLSLSPSGISMMRICRSSPNRYNER